MERVRIGLIGAGFAAHLHAHSFQKVKGIRAEIVGAAAIPLKSTEEFAKKFNVPHCYDDYRYLLDDTTIDIVDICVPNALHKRVCIESAMAGKNIICEKPLTGYFGENLGEEVELVGHAVPKSEMYKRAMQNADEIMATVKEKRARLGYAENFIYAPAVEKARRLIRASGGDDSWAPGRGKPQRLSCCVCAPLETLRGRCAPALGLTTHRSSDPPEAV
ncbi:MAG: Gfo/Idh/MocA family protein [Candidatus Caldatribacteriaceae bacterium]